MTKSRKEMAIRRLRGEIQYIEEQMTMYKRELRFNAYSLAGENWDMVQFHKRWLRDLKRDRNDKKVSLLNMEL